MESPPMPLPQANGANRSYDPNHPRPDALKEISRHEGWTGKNGSQEFRTAKKKIFIIGAVIVGFIGISAASAIIVAKIRQSAFSENRVTCTLSGPAEADSGKQVQFEVACTNDNRKALSDATVTIRYPEQFAPSDSPGAVRINATSSEYRIGSIPSRVTARTSITGSFYAPQSETVYLNAVLTYSPEGMSSSFETTVQWGLVMTSSPLILSLAAPKEVPSGGAIECLLEYRNLSDRELSDVRVQGEFPKGFTLSGAEPAPSEPGGVWYLGNLAAGKQGRITIRGVLGGNSNEQKAITFSAGNMSGGGEFIRYTHVQHAVRIVATALSITQSVNGAARTTIDPGELLAFLIIYRNDGDIGLRDVIISLEISSKILDFSRLQLPRGQFDAERSMITWRASDIKELTDLAPGAGGEIKFSVPVADRIPVTNKNDKNFTVLTTAKIDSPDVPTPVGANKIIASNTISLKLNSRIIAETSGFYQDEHIINTGPIPPRVGQPTSYAIRWQVTNVCNDVSGVRLTANIPTGVVWTGKTYPESENLEYNERTGQVTWNLGTLEAATGILLPKREARFQVRTTPQSHQVGQSPRLISTGTLIGNDLFTEVEASVTVPEKTTQLPEDPTIPSSGYDVIANAP